LADEKNIRESRAAYRILGKEPSRYRVSSEALIRRILQEKPLYHINNVVDTNNLISIETKYSCGSYDLDKLGEDLVFRIGKTGESYKGIGKEIVNIENLPVFADERGAYGSPTSDSERAMITKDTSRVLTLLISFGDLGTLERDLRKARLYLEKYAKAGDIRTEMVG
jgi:DNA/RNA-binding domain of Phe-tRNA-synthetase-like protein